MDSRPACGQPWLVEILRYPYLFNFAASYSSGGFKRLQEYSRWFDAAGGAMFVIHPSCASLRVDFPRNRYFEVQQGVMTRLTDDCGYLRDIEKETGRPDFYYSYGVPLYAPFGHVDWFHLSNVLPMVAWTAPLTFTDRLKFSLLRRRIERSFRWAHVVSAESRSSIASLEAIDPDRTVVSVNGSDDELASLASARPVASLPVVTAVGTYRYKALADTVRVFHTLRTQGLAEELHIFGNPDWVAPRVRRAAHVQIRGNLPRADLIRWLRRSRFYLSTTRIENSYNAASEGMFSAEESYISDIGPHRELLAGTAVRRERFAGVAEELLHVRRAELDSAPLKTWDTVIREMLSRFESARSGESR